MNADQKKAFDGEICQAKLHIKKQNYDQAFMHLERAHIIGQLSVIAHTLSHVYMLKVGILKKDAREIFGQILRLPLGVIGSAVGIVPTGNSGGSNVSPFQKMDIPEDIQQLF